jgi:hypothetical protein
VRDHGALVLSKFEVLARNMRLVTIFTIALLPFCLSAASAQDGRQLLGQDSHSYKDGEEVKLLVNKIGPFRNPRCAKLLCFVKVQFVLGS